MLVRIHSPHEYFYELHPHSSQSSVPLSSQKCTADLTELVDEAYTSAMLAEALPVDLECLDVQITPVWKEEPLVGAIAVSLGSDGGPALWSGEFQSGPWERKGQRRAAQLREEHVTAPDEPVRGTLLAVAEPGSPLPAPVLRTPVITDATLEDCSVRDLQSKQPDPDRPILLNARVVQDALRMCRDADVLEAGGAVLGRLVRLPEPLPGCRTRITTILTSIVEDPRHEGAASQLAFSPAALADAQQMCALRGLGERVLTVFHSHGWSNRCGNCNQNASCPLFESAPSVQDYEQLLGQLLPSKDTVLPIAGRKLGAPVRQPVLQVHAWRGGQMQPHNWGTYED